MSPSPAPQDQDLEPPAPLQASPSTERSISPVAGGAGAGRAGRATALIALVAGCAAVLAATWKSDGPKAAKAPLEPARQIVPFEPAQPPPGAAPTLTNPGASPPSLTSDDPGPSAALQPDVAARSDPAAQTVQGPANHQARSLTASAQASRFAPLLAYSQGSVTDDARFDEAPASSSVAEPGATDLDQLRRGSSLGRAMARPVGDRNFLILAGTSIPCVLQTALDSATPGYVSCVIPTDVYSDNGAVILLEKGSKVLGEYHATLRQGQRRLVVLWTRAVTPLGVSIALASPASDALGRAGFDGALDNHFWARFGGAMLLSIIDQGAWGGASANNASQTARTPSDAAAVAVENSVNIPPSLRKAQGSEVSIFAAQDFDFSSVYALRSR